MQTLLVHLGYCHRTTADKIRTAEALEHLPELARAQPNDFSPPNDEDAPRGGLQGLDAT